MGRIATPTEHNQKCDHGKHRDQHDVFDRHALTIWMVSANASDVWQQSQ